MSERLPRSDADAIAEQLRIFAQPQRLMILAELLGGERSVGEIEAATAIGQPALSQQLAELRRAALVDPRREARMIFYSIADTDVEARVRALLSVFDSGFAAPRPATRPPSTRPSLVGAASFARIG